MKIFTSYSSFVKSKILFDFVNFWYLNPIRHMKRTSKLVLFWVTSASWQHKTSFVFFPLLNNRNSSSIHRQKCLWGSWGIKHHIPRDSGWVPTTYESGNRQTNLGPDSAPHPKWPMNWLQPILVMVQEPEENSALDNYQQMRDSLCGSLGFQTRSSSTPLERKNEFGWIGVSTESWAVWLEGGERQREWQI